MKYKTAVCLWLVFCLSGCVGDIQVEIRGQASESSNCMFRRFSDGKIVESFKINGAFSEKYAVSNDSTPAKRVEIMCDGRVVASKNLTTKQALIDFGNIQPQ